MADPKYQPTGAGFQDVKARMAESSAVSDLEAKEKRLEEQQGRVAEAEKRGGRARKENTGARSQAIDVINQQITSLNNLATTLGRETEALLANTRAWKTNSESRVAAVGGARYPATSAGFGDTRAQIAASADLERKATAQAATQVLASRTNEAAALASLRTLSSQAPYPPRQLLLPQRTTPFTRPTFVAGPAGTEYVGAEQGRVSRPPAPARPTLPAYGVAATEAQAYTAAEREAITAGEAMQRSIAGVGAAQAATNTIWRQSVAEVASASQATTRHGALTAEFIQSLVRGEATLKEFQGQLVTTIGKFAGWAVAGGLVYGAFEALKHVVEGAKATATGVAQLERAGLPNFNKREAEEGFRSVSQRLNVPIGGPEGAYEAQFYATRAGFRNQQESLKVGETALIAQKLDQVPIQDSTRALGALHVAFGLNADAIRRVFEELDVGQLKFNARLNQTLPQLGRAAASVANAGGDVHEFAQQLITVVGATGGGGGQGGGNPATFFLREAGNIQRPQAEATLREFHFDPKKGLENITAFNKELIERGKDLAPDARRAIAQAVGGGTAIGGRYAIALLNSGIGPEGGRFGQVSREVSKPGHSVEEDLSHRLHTLDEQFVSLGLTFERIGGEIGRIGLTRVAEDFITVFRTVGDVLEVVGKPAIALGQALQELPGPLQQLIVIAGLGVGAQKLAGTRVGSGLGRLGGEAIPGFIQGPESRELRNLSRTTSEGLRNARNTTEARAREFERQASSADDVALERRAFAARIPQFSSQAEREGFYKSPAGLNAAAQEAALVAREDAAIAIRERSQQRLLGARQRQLLLEDQEAILANRQLGAKQKLSALAELNASAARAGIAANSVIVNAAGPVGTAYEARGGARGGTTGGGVILPPGAAADEARAATRATNAAGVALAGSMAGAAEQTKAESSVMAAAWADGTARIKLGIQEMVDALFVGSIDLAAGGRGLRGGAGNVLGGAGTVAGGVFNTIGKNAMSAFFTAYIGQAIAQLIGSAVGGSAGSTISSIGGYTAIGAGIGSVLPGGPLTTGLGALGGFAFGLGKKLAGGGGSGPALSDTARLKREEEQRVSVERLQASAYGAPGSAVEALAREEGLIGGSAGENLEQVSEEYGAELEKAFKDEGKTAQEAKANIEKHLKQIAAQLQLYGTESVTGVNARTELKGATAAISEKLFAHPQNVAEESALLSQTIGIQGQAARKELDRQLKSATTPAGRQEALQSYRNRIQEVYASYTERGQHLEGQLGTQRSEQQRIAVEQAELAKTPATRGNQGDAGKLANRMKAITKEIAQTNEAIRRYHEAKPQLDRELQQLNEEGATATYEKEEQQIGLDSQRALLHAHGNRRQEENAERAQADKLARAAKETYGGKYPKAEEQAEVQVQELRNKTIQKGLQNLETQGQLELSKVPQADQAKRAALTQQNAQKALNYIRGHRGAFDWKEVVGAQIALNQAKQAAEAAQAAELSQTAQLEGEIAQAQDQGNAQAQAADAQRTAARILALAKTPLEKLQGRLGVIQAQNQADQAYREHIQALGALSESQTTDPLKQAEIKVRTDKRLVGAAQGPDERISAQADLNKAKADRAAAFLQVRESDVNFQLEMQQISKQQAIQQYEDLLKIHGLAKSQRQDLQLKIRSLQQAASGEGEVFSIKPGDIKLPTAYDVHRAIAGARLQAGAGVRIAGEHAQPTTSGVTAHITNTNHIVIDVRHPGDVARVGEEIERVTGASLRGRQRAAGVR